AYVSAWVRRYVWRLPVEVPYVPKRRRLGFAVYAITSGIYCYTVLYIVARFVGNVFRNFNPDWSFVPELATGALIFRSRIRRAVNLMKFVYLDKKDRLRIWLTSKWRPWAIAGIIGFLLLPLWRESISGRFVLEASDRAVIRAQMAGVVENVYVEEGQTVFSGAPLLRLRNEPLESKRARSEADYRVAAADVNSAELHYVGTGTALQKRDQLRQESRILAAEVTALELRSPITGVVTTPRLLDRLGSYVTTGTELAEVANTRAMRARIYVSEYQMYKYRSMSVARLYVDGIFGKWDAGSLTVSPRPSEIAPGLLDISKFKDMRSPTFYAIDLFLKNENDRLKPGMVGTARVYGRRRSAAGFWYQAVADFAGRKLW
ncbi:MAG: HlyD family efflux transporter periplasmic adaptor subunit, partial [Candidatus Sulfotelmatobacter sp.]